MGEKGKHKNIGFMYIQCIKRNIHVLTDSMQNHKCLGLISEKLCHHDSPWLCVRIGLDVPSAPSKRKWDITELVRFGIGLRLRNWSPGLH
jgi:hypothetical protein